MLLKSETLLVVTSIVMMVLAVGAFVAVLLTNVPEP
jgi:hypothetical protein